MGLWKLRVGDYRVCYEIQERTVTVWAIRNRRDVYTILERRRPTLYVRPVKGNRLVELLVPVEWEEGREVGVVRSISDVVARSLTSSRSPMRFLRQ